MKTVGKPLILLVFVTSNRAVEFSSITLSYSIPTRCRTPTHDCATFACTNEKSPRLPSLISSHLLMTISPTFKPHYCCARSRPSSRKLKRRIMWCNASLSRSSKTSSLRPHRWTLASNTNAFLRQRLLTILFPSPLSALRSLTILYTLVFSVNISLHAGNLLLSTVHTFLSLSTFYIYITRFTRASDLASSDYPGSRKRTMSEVAEMVTLVACFVCKP